jgi:hypothetical protein
MHVHRSVNRGAEALRCVGQRWRQDRVGTPAELVLRLLFVLFFLDNKEDNKGQRVVCACFWTWAGRCGHGLYRLTQTGPKLVVLLAVFNNSWWVSSQQRGSPVLYTLPEYILIAMRWAGGEKIKIIHLDGVWWAGSSYPCPPSGTHISWSISQLRTFLYRIGKRLFDFPWTHQSESIFPP